MSTSRRERRALGAILTLGLIISIVVAGVVAGGLQIRRAVDGLVESLSGASVSGRVIDRMTVHHTASGPTSGGRSVDVTLVAEWHRRRGLGLGYKDSRACAYHFLILRDGTVQRGRPLGRGSSGTKNRQDNARTIAVCLVGDFGPRRAGAGWSGMWPSPAQLRELERIARWAFERYGFGPDSVRGHREVASSECPGRHVDLDELRRRLRR